MNKQGILGILTPENFTEILKKNNFITNEKITEITHKKIETVTSHLYFIEVKFDKEWIHGESSKNMVLKSSKKQFEIDAEHETNFYKHVLSAKKRIPVPVCYDAGYDDKCGAYYILLDDVSDTHHEIEDYPLPPTLPHIEKALDCLAEFHAAWWDHPELSKHTGYFADENDYFKFFNGFEKMTSEAFDFLGDRLTRERKELLRQIFSEFPYKNWERYKSRKNMTIIHGDAHFWNFFYPKDLESGKALLIDWQSWETAVGARDCAYMLAFHCYPETRRKLENMLLNRYHELLQENYVESYDFDEFLYDYKLSVIQNFITPVMQCSHRANPETWWHSLEIAFLNFEDLNCTEILK